MSAGFIDACLPPSDVPTGSVLAAGHVPTGHNAVWVIIHEEFHEMRPLSYHAANA